MKKTLKSTTQRAALFVFCLLMCAWVTACPSQPLFTDPCEEDCNEEAVIGSTCEVAEDCYTGSFCNLTQPGGYCQEFCAEDAEAGTECGGDEEGQCVDSGGEEGFVCMASCAMDETGSCARSDLSCRSIAGNEAGICVARCQSDGECGSGQACDTLGECRTTTTCNVQTHQGCAGGQSCIISESGQTFCGELGSQGQGAACRSGADCREGTLCADNVCKATCNVDDFSACGGIPADCFPVARGASLGVCL